MKQTKSLEKKFNHIMNKVSDKMIAMGMMAGLIVSLIPILILAFYNYPCADDFSASDTAHWAWMKTGSIFEVLKAAIENVIYNYENWSGVYASVFWTSLQPGLFGEQFYGVTTVISILLFVSAGIYLTYVIGSKYIKGNSYSWIAICVLYIFSSIQCMPDGNEGLYWHAGGANYTWAFAFMLLLTACILALYKEENTKKKSVKFISACILAVLVGGGNYITALQGCIWLVLINAVMVFADKQSAKISYGKVLKKNSLLILPTFVTAIAFLISVLAPGNAVRMGSSTGMGPVESILESFHYALVVPVEYWLKWPVWILLAISVPFMWNIVKEQKFSFSYPGIVALSGFCLVAAGFTPCLYAQGTMQAGRLHDTVYYILMIILYSVTFYMIGWMYRLKNGNINLKKQKSDRMELSSVSKKWILGMLLVWSVGSIFSMRTDTGIYIGTDALYAIISGKAEEYRQVNEKRLELLESAEENVILPKFTNVPSLLQFNDISTNPMEWLNTAMAVYYEKESVQREE